MCRVLRLTIRCTSEGIQADGLLTRAAEAAELELLGVSRVRPRATVVVACDDGRPDELVAIDFAVALRALAGTERLEGAVRLADDVDPAA